MNEEDSYTNVAALGSDVDTDADLNGAGVQTGSWIYKLLDSEGTVLDDTSLNLQKGVVTVDDVNGGIFSYTPTVRKDKLLTVALCGIRCHLFWPLLFYANPPLMNP